MRSESFNNAELIKKNGHLAYTATKRNGNKTEIYLLQGKTSKIVYLHVFVSDERGQERHDQGSSLEEILSSSALAEYEEILTDVWNRRSDILSTHKQVSVGG